MTYFRASCAILNAGSEAVPAAGKMNEVIQNTVIIVEIVGFFVGLIILYIAGNWIEDKLRKKPTAEELAIGAAKWRARLHNPQLQEVEDFLQGKLPRSVVAIYDDAALLDENDFYVIQPGCADAETWQVETFTPCHVEDQMYNFLPQGKDGPIEWTGPGSDKRFFSFASDLFGNSYYVEVTPEQCDDATVYFLQHDGGELYKKLADSVAEFLSWERRPAEQSDGK